MKEHESLPFHEVRSEVPLTDSDLEAIRSTVMTEITRRSSRQWSVAFRLVFAAACVAVIGIASLLLMMLGHSKSSMTPSDFKVVIKRPETIARSKPLPPPSSPTPSVDRSPVTRPSPTSVAEMPRESRAARSPRRKRDREVTQVASNETRVAFEIQTSNPDIRIIWMAN